MIRLPRLYISSLLASFVSLSAAPSNAAGLFEGRVQPIADRVQTQPADETSDSGFQLASFRPATSAVELCSCGLGGGSSDRLLGFIAPSDRAFDEFISPITNPLFFEDPRTLSEIRTIFVQHWIPESNPVLLGGEAQYVAVQARVALTERLSFIANKDGYIWLNSNNEPVIPDDEGWADIAAGLKYNIIRNPSLPLVVSLGGTFEIPSGSGGVLQGSGDGEFHLFGTAGVGLTERVHWLSATGFRLPTNTSQRSQMWYWSNHVDYEFLDSWYGLVELNWFHWMQSGDRLPLTFEGGDLFNFGATGVAGNDIVTLGVGGKKRFGEMHELGFGYESSADGSARTCWNRESMST